MFSRGYAINGNKFEKKSNHETIRTPPLNHKFRLHRLSIWRIYCLCKINLLQEGCYTTRCVIVSNTSLATAIAGSPAWTLPWTIILLKGGGNLLK